MMKWCPAHGGVDRRFIQCIGVRRGAYSLVRLCCFLLVLLNTACSTLPSMSDPSESGDGSSAFLVAAKDPRTWVPAVAAVLIAATDSDLKISRWASEHNPIYGSQQRADEASDLFRGLLATSALVTSIVSPGRQGVLLSERPGSLATFASAAMTNSYITDSVKESAGRLRPTGTGTRSFPSGHTSAASSYATIASLRTDELQLSESTRRTLSNTYYTLAAATAWARVEAKAHYPTDVLLGFALGNFTSRLLNEALLGSDSPAQVDVECELANESCQMIIRVPF